MQSGFSAANLLITVVLQPNGEGHAVLTVRTTDGDFILDNLRSGIRPWWQTEYAFMAEAGRWQSKRCGKSSIEKVGCGRSAKKVEKI